MLASARRSSFRAISQLAIAAAVLAVSRPAASETAPVQTRLVLDHVEAQPSTLGERVRLRLFLTAVTLEGGIIPLPGDAALLFQLGASKQRIPYLLGSFANTGAELAGAVVLQVGNDYEADMPVISDALSRHLREWPADARALLVRYGLQIAADDRPRNVRAVAADVAASLTELDSGDPQLLSAVSKAISALEAVQPTRPGGHLRKVVIIVSDGRDPSADPAAYRAVADAAAKAGIRIHTIAYSPVDNRRPLLGLGELSKGSRGTFRWVRSLEGFDPQLRTLASELRDQYVVTLFANPGELDGKTIAVRHQDLSSEALAIPAPSCAGSPCDGACVSARCVSRPQRAGILGWLLRAGAVLVAALLLFGAIQAMRGRGQKRRMQSQQRADDIRAAASAQQQAALAHRIVAHGPQGQVIAPQPGASQMAASRAPEASGRIVGALPGGGQAQAGPARAAAPAQGYIQVTTGPLSRRRFELHHGFNIGSGPDCHLVLSGDRAVARYHAQIVLDAAGGVLLVDRGSPTGTYVNGTRITQMRLNHGNAIRIGATEIRFLVS